MTAHKLRSKLHDTATHIEFLCVACKDKARVVRSKKNLTVKKLKNGAYLVQSKIDCKGCRKHRKVAKFVSAVKGAALKRAGH